MIPRALCHKAQPFCPQLVSKACFSNSLKYGVEFDLGGHVAYDQQSQSTLSLRSVCCLRSRSAPSRNNSTIHGEATPSIPTVGEQFT